MPLATWIGQTFGWRAAFVLVGVIGAVTCALISRCVPQVAPVLGALLAVAGLLIFAWSLKEERRESTPDAVVKGVEQPCATRAG